MLQQALILFGNVLEHININIPRLIITTPLSTYNISINLDFPAI